MPPDAKLTNRRNGHKGRVTVISQLIETELAKPSPSIDTLETNLEELIRQNDTIAELDSAILDEAENITEEIESQSVYNMNVNTVIRKTKRYIASFQSESRQATETNRNLHTNTKFAKLPYLSLLKFDGDPLNWTKFWESFRTSVHMREDIAPSNKFQYLVGQLEGDAAQLLAGFTHTDSEYKEAIELLSNTFGQPNILLATRLNAIFDIEPPQPTSESLRKFRSTFEGHLRVLKAQGSEVEQSGYIFAHLLLRKLPASTRDNLNRANKTESWSLERFRSAMQDEIQHLTSLHDASNQGSTRDSVNDSYVESVNTASFPVSAKKTNSCRFCFGDHLVFNCTQYPTPEERRARVKKLDLCFNCLYKNHTVSKCVNKVSCKNKNCNKRHHTSLCFQNDKKVSTSTVHVGEKEDLDDETKPEYSMTIASSSVVENHEKSTILPTAKITMTNPNSKFELKDCKALLDNCSQRTFISTSVSKKLDLKTDASIQLQIDGFGSKGKLENYNLVKLGIQTCDGIVEIPAIVVDKLPSRLTMHGRSNVVKNLKKKGIILADDSLEDSYSEISIIIGIDNLHHFVYASKISENLYQVPSKFGTIIQGTVDGKNPNVSVSTVLHINIESKNLDNEIRNMWELDTVGIREPSLDNSDALDKFNENIKFAENKYEVGLPWKDENIFLPTNENIALKRLRSVWNSLLSDKTKLEHYDSIMKQQLELGFIEPVEGESDGHNIHYLPHHGVAKESDTTPLRVVFDCSAREQNGVSLNDCLFTGPSLVNDLCSILLRFRTKNYACVSDVEKAFLMVGLRKEDRDSCRFFWPDNPFDPNSKIKTFRFKVVLFGSTASQFLLNSTVLFHLSKFSTESAEKIKRNLYVDNLVATFDTEQEAKIFYDEAKGIMHEGGFNLREWSCNSDSFLDYVKPADKCSKNTLKVLGISWNRGSDEILIKPYICETPKKLTKRVIVSAVSKTYDPYGYLLPCTVQGRLIVQSLWKEGFSWDEPLEEPFVSLWKNYLKNLENVKYELKRKMNTYKSPTLHVLADASSKCYGAVGYFVEEGKSDFVIAKSRLAPLKSPSLPQLELTALNIAAKLANFICESYSAEFNIEKVVLWSDSSVAIQWCNNKKPNNKPYVRQRVENIRNLCPNAEIRFIAGKDNTADLLTRGISYKEFNDNKFWVSGPLILHEARTTNVQNILDCAQDLDNDRECVVSVQQNVCNEPLIDVSRYSSYKKALRVTALVLKFVQCKTSMFKGVSQPNFSSGDISCSETALAEKVLIKMYQKSHYGDVLNYLTGASKFKPNLVDQLDLILDENSIIRTKGRLSNCKYLNQSQLILLPSESQITRLIVVQAHETCLHAGVNSVLSYVREKWWIPRGRQIIRKIIRKCVPCLKVVGKSFKPPHYPPLPADRVNDVQPFQIVGVDYTGALSVRDGNSVTKAYIALFTCAVSRSIHLELVYSLSSEDFIRAMTKFSCRRSYPSVCISDNGTNFVGTATILKKIAKDNLVTNYMLDNGIEWRFITPRAASHGGFYERLIGMTKRTIQKVIGKALLSKSDLETLIVQVEARLNDRPLTYASSDIRDLSPITPSSLIMGHRIREFPCEIDFDQFNDPEFGTANFVNKLFLRRSKILQEFWRRWYSEYLTSLRERGNISSSVDLVRVGQVVLISENLPRSKWKLGLIEDLIPSSDGITRSVKVRTSLGSVLRPVTMLYPLELQFDEPRILAPTNVVERPRRLAAKNALEKIARACT